MIETMGLNLSRNNCRTNNCNAKVVPGKTLCIEHIREFLCGYEGCYKSSIPNHYACNNHLCKVSECKYPSLRIEKNDTIIGFGIFKSTGYCRNHTETA